MCARYQWHGHRHVWPWHRDRTHGNRHGNNRDRHWKWYRHTWDRYRQWHRDAGDRFGKRHWNNWNRHRDRHRQGWIRHRQWIWLRERFGHRIRDNRYG